MAQTADEILIAGHEAAALLTSDTFREAVQRVRDGIIAEWSSATGPDKIEMREDLHRKFALLEDLITALHVPVRKARAIADDDTVN